MKLILAIKKPPFIYKGTDILQDGGFKNFYYNTPFLNCLYNCDYCFLQGMYPSANMVVFVNQSEMQLAVEDEIIKAGCDGYIAKPFSLPKFIKTVADHID